MWGALARAVAGPVIGIFEKKQARAAAREAAQAELARARQDDRQEIHLRDKDLESILAASTGGTWKDEYVTVSVLLIVNLIVAGGVLAAFGKPEVLEGVTVAVRELVALGVDVGFLIQAVVVTGIGLSVYRKI